MTRSEQDQSQRVKGFDSRFDLKNEPVKDANGKVASDYLNRDFVEQSPELKEALKKDREERGEKTPTNSKNHPLSPLTKQPFAIFAHSKNFTEEEDAVIINGLLAHLPLYIIANKIHCSRAKLSDHIKDSELLRQVWADREESLLDMVEFQAKRLVESGNPAMIMFWLERKGRDRGWSQEMLNEVKEDEGRIVIGEIPQDMVKKADEEIAHRNEKSGLNGDGRGGEEITAQTECLGVAVDREGNPVVGTVGPNGARKMAKDLIITPSPIDLALREEDMKMAYEAGRSDGTRDALEGQGGVSDVGEVIDVDSFDGEDPNGEGDAPWEN